jgi:tryptophanyl-tRNA synthetase
MSGHGGDLVSKNSRVFSGMQPSGDVHLGNYLGALRSWVADQYEFDAIYCVVDLHAITIEHDPATLADRTIDLAIWLLAAGVDPSICTLFVQSHVPEHAELAWVLGSVATYGELGRMTQFKDKSGKQEAVRADLYTYPVLMAADILLYGTNRVPVGDDQRQHLELARDVAIRFNNRYGDTFVVPDAAIPTVAARVMDLQDPTRKMSKSESSPLGTVLLSDPPEVIERKVKRAVTDTETDVRYDPVKKPGVSNLLELLSAATGRSPGELAGDYPNYGSLKADTAAALIELIKPVQERRSALEGDLGHIREVLTEGAAKATAIARPTWERASAAVGFLPRY